MKKNNTGYAFLGDAIIPIYRYLGYPIKPILYTDLE